MPKKTVVTRPKKNIAVKPEVDETVTPSEPVNVPVEEEVTAPEEEVAPTKGGSVDVVDENGNYIRTYSVGDHGKDYKTLATQFISDRKGYSLK